MLEATGRLGSANLDQIYRALARSVGASYAEFVHAVRSMVQHGLVICEKEHARYFYRVEG